jgi:hypothetical protein
MLWRGERYAPVGLGRFAVEGRPENEVEAAVALGRGTCKPVCDCDDHWRLIEAELGAEGPRFDIEELDRIRLPVGSSPASMAAVSGVLMPLCRLLEPGVCRFGDPSLPMDRVRLEPSWVEGLLVVPESESAIIVLVGER